MSIGVLGVLKTVGTEAVKIGGDVVHVVEEIGVGAADTVKVLTTANKLSPELKSGLALLVTDGETLATSFVAAGSNPANFAADTAAVQSLQKFVTDFVAFLPTLKSAVAEFEADVTPATPATT